MPKVSVIIPVYNTERYLKRCIESILAQSLSDIEVILIDDGSTDLSPEICEEYAARDHRVKVFHQKNGGVSTARNRGLGVAHGEYIHFADSDDFLEEGFYSDLYNLARNYGADICCSTYVQETKNGEISPVSESDERISMTCEEAINALFSGHKVSYSLCDKIFKRNIIAEITFNELISHNEDYLFCYEAIKRSNKIAYTSKSYYHYCYNPESATRSGFSHKRMTAIDVHEYVLYDIKLNYNNLYKCARTELCKVALYTRKQMDDANYLLVKDIERLDRIIWKNLPYILLSKLAPGYKLLAIKYSLSTLF